MRKWLALAALLGGMRHAQADTRLIYGLAMGPTGTSSKMPASIKNGSDDGMPMAMRTLFGVRVNDLQFDAGFVTNSVFGGEAVTMAGRADVRAFFGRGWLADGWEAYGRLGAGHAWLLGMTTSCASCSGGSQVENLDGGVVAGAVGMLFRWGPESFGGNFFVELERQYFRLEDDTDFEVQNFMIGVNMSIRLRK